MTNLQITALQVVLFINENRKANSRDIAKGLGISVSHMEGILSKLKKANIVRATRGIGGGYFLVRKLSEIKLIEVLSLYQASINSLSGVMINNIINKSMSNITMEDLNRELSLNT